MCDSELIRACVNGDKNECLRAIERGAFCWNWGLANACLTGHKDCALLMIEKGAVVNAGLEQACLRGHMDLVIALSRYKEQAIDWNLGLYQACFGGHKDLALFLIEQGACDWNNALINVNNGLFNAQINNSNDASYIHLALFLVEKGANIKWFSCDFTVIEIDYLLKKNINIRPFYSKEIEYCFKVKQSVIETLPCFLLKDLCLIIQEY